MDVACSCNLGCYSEAPTRTKGVFPSISPLPQQFSPPIFHHPTSRRASSLAGNFSCHPFILGPSPDLICLPLLHHFSLPFHIILIFHWLAVCHPSPPPRCFFPSLSDVSVAFLQSLMYILPRCGMLEGDTRLCLTVKTLDEGTLNDLLNSTLD